MGPATDKHQAPTHRQSRQRVYRRAIKEETIVLNRDLVYFCLFDLILYVPLKIFQLNGDRSSWILYFALILIKVLLKRVFSIFLLLV